MTDETHDEDKVVREIIAHLLVRLPEAPADEVERTVVALFHEWADSPVRSFLPVLVEKEARERLRQRVLLSA